MSVSPRPSEVRIALPSWVDGFVDWERAIELPEDRVRLAVALSRENVLRGTGGPFGAAVFEGDTGALVAVGVNLVVPLRSSGLHAEVVAFLFAHARVGSRTLAAPGLPPHELATSCEPCAMCLGAALWSGVRRVRYGATREDAVATGFEEGPVFPESRAYIEERGIAIEGPFLREEAREVLRLYRERGGAIYNG